MEQLGGAGIGQKLLEIGGGILAGGKLHRMADPIPGGQLRQAQPVALGIEAQGFGVDGDQRPQIQTVRQVALIQLDLHSAPIAQAWVN